MRDTSVDQMRHLRSQARKLGLKIQTRRAVGSEPVRYRVLDPATNAPIGADLLGLDDVQARLWWIVRDREREREGAGEPPAAEEVEHCPVCGTPRMGFFRLCMTCGLDYEAQVKTPADPLGSSSNGLGNGTHPAAAPVESGALPVASAAVPAAPEPPLALSDTSIIPGAAAAAVTSDGLEDPELPEVREVYDLPKGPNILVRLGYSVVDAVGALGKVLAWAILIVVAVGLVTLFANSMR